MSVWETAYLPRTWQKNCVNTLNSPTNCSDVSGMNTGFCNYPSGRRLFIPVRAFTVLHSRTLAASPPQKRTSLIERLTIPAGKTLISLSGLKSSWVITTLWTALRSGTFAMNWKGFTRKRSSSRGGIHIAAVMPKQYWRPRKKWQRTTAVLWREKNPFKEARTRSKMYPTISNNGLLIMKTGRNVCHLFRTSSVITWSLFLKGSFRTWGHRKAVRMRGLLRTWKKPFWNSKTRTISRAKRFRTRLRPLPRTTPLYSSAGWQMSW